MEIEGLVAATTPETGRTDLTVKLKNLYADSVKNLLQKDLTPKEQALTATTGIPAGAIVGLSIYLAEAAVTFASLEQMAYMYQEGGPIEKGAAAGCVLIIVGGLAYVTSDTRYGNALKNIVLAGGKAGVHVGQMAAGAAVFGRRLLEHRRSFSRFLQSEGILTPAEIEKRDFRDLKKLEGR